MPDPRKALGEHVEQKPTDKLLDREAHHLHFVVMSVVPPTETALAVLASEEALVTDSDPMRIAPEVGEDLLRTAEGGFGVNHPVLGPELGEAPPFRKTAHEFGAGGSSWVRSVGYVANGAPYPLS